MKKKSEEEEKRSWNSLKKNENGTFPWVRVFLHRLQSGLQTPYLRNRSTQEEMSTLWGTLYSKNSVQLDSFPGPTQLSVACSTASNGKLGGTRLVFSYMYTRLFINACTV